MRCLHCGGMVRGGYGCMVYVKLEGRFGVADGERRGSGG